MLTRFSVPRWPILLASCVFVLGVALFWVGPEPLWHSRCLLESKPSGPETIGLTYRASVWPPGTECVYTSANGIETHSTYVPWAEWLAVLALAAAMGATASRLLRTTARPSRRLAVSIGALTIGLGAVFAGPAVGLILLVLAISALIWLGLRYGDSRAASIDR